VGGVWCVWLVLDCEGGGGGLGGVFVCVQGGSRALWWWGRRGWGVWSGGGGKVGVWWGGGGVGVENDDHSFSLKKGLGGDRVLKRNFGRAPCSGEKRSYYCEFLVFREEAKVK